MASSKRQTTFAKLQREQRVKERRQLKQEKKQAARAAKAGGIAPEGETEAGEETASAPVDDTASAPVDDTPTE